MSTERNELTSETNRTISVTAFNGGRERNRCLQLTQSFNNGRSFDGIGHVQLDKEQAMQLVADITRWLAGE